MSSMFVNVFGSGRTTKMKKENHDLTLVKRYLEGALDAKFDGSQHHGGYQAACQNVLSFLKSIEERR